MAIFLSLSLTAISLALLRRKFNKPVEIHIRSKPTNKLTPKFLALPAPPSYKGTPTIKLKYLPTKIKIKVLW